MKYTMTVFSCMFLCVALGNETTGNTELIAQVKGLLRQVENREPERVRTLSYFREPYSHRWWQSPEFVQLKTMTSEHWKEILDNIGDIAPSELHQFILFRSFYALPQDDFFQCLNKIADLCLDNIVSKHVFDATVLHYETRIPYYEPTIKTTHILARNYDTPDVAEMLRKAKVIFSDDETKVQEYGQIALGAKKNLVTSPWYNPDTGTCFYDDLFPRMSRLGFVGVIVIGIIIIGAILAWRCFRKK